MCVTVNFNRSLVRQQNIKLGTNPGPADIQRAALYTYRSAAAIIEHGVPQSKCDAGIDMDITEIKCV